MKSNTKPPRGGPVMHCGDLLHVAAEDLHLVHNYLVSLLFWKYIYTVYTGIKSWRKGPLTFPKP